MLKEREIQVTTLEGELSRVNEEVHSYKCRNQIVNELLESKSGEIGVSDLDRLIEKYSNLLNKEEASVKALDAKVTRFYSFDRFM